jgi:hypothetical protein
LCRSEHRFARSAPVGVIVGETIAAVNLLADLP